MRRRIAFGDRPVRVLASAIESVVTGAFSGFPGDPLQGSGAVRAGWEHPRSRICNCDQGGVPVASRPTSRTATYLLRMTPDEKAHLEDMARRAETTLADALREGARAHLVQKVLKVVPGGRAEIGGGRAIAT